MHSFRYMACPRVCLFLFCLSILSGCASKYGTQMTQVNYFPACYQPIAGLRQSESNFTQTTVASAAVGTMLGAILGAIATGDARGAMIGAAAGAVAGTTAGYYQAKRNQIADDNRRMASYLSDLDGDISNLDRVSAAGRLAIQCYDKQFRDSINQYKQGRISKQELMARYGEIRTGTDEANRIMGTVVGGALDKEHEYRTALASEYPNSQALTSTKMATQSSQSLASSDQKTVKTSQKSSDNSKKSAKTGSTASSSSKKTTPTSKTSQANSTLQAKTSSATVAVAKPVSSPETVEQALYSKTQSYANSREAVESVRDEISAKQASWDDELAALKG